MQRNFVFFLTCRYRALMSSAVVYQPLPIFIHTDGLSAHVAAYVRWQSSWARGSTTGDSFGKWSAAWGSQDVHKVPHPMRSRKKRRKRMRMMMMKLRTSWTCLTWWALSVSKYRNKQSWLVCHDVWDDVFWVSSIGNLLLQDWPWLAWSEYHTKVLSSLIAFLLFHFLMHSMSTAFQA